MIATTPSLPLTKWWPSLYDEQLSLGAGFGKGYSCVLVHMGSHDRPMSACVLSSPPVFGWSVSLTAHFGDYPLLPLRGPAIVCSPLEIPTNTSCWHGSDTFGHEILRPREQSKVTSVVKGKGTPLKWTFTQEKIIQEYCTIKAPSYHGTIILVIDCVTLLTFLLQTQVRHLWQLCVCYLHEITTVIQ